MPTTVPVVSLCGHWTIPLTISYIINKGPELIGSLLTFFLNPEQKDFEGRWGLQ